MQDDEILFRRQEEFADQLTGLPIPDLHGIVFATDRQVFAVWREYASIAKSGLYKLKHLLAGLDIPY